MNKAIWTGLFLAMLTASAASAAEPGVPAMGEQLSKAWCANCHLVKEQGAASTSADAPPFTAIASRLGDEAYRETMTVWLTKPHGNMSGLSLSRAEITDILAYIESLRAPK
jgi:mono/diheme cytochrome c family protein